MSGVRDVLKGGWHPKDKGGDRETWRGQFKGVDQVAGWMGKGRKDSASTSSADRVSRPLTTLKDPSLFGPPPKNVNYHGGAALPNEITPHTGGLGAPLKPTEIEKAGAVAQAEAQPEPEARRAPPPTPFRADRTGLKTDTLPPPPIHRGTQIVDNTTNPAQSTPKPKPSLPPRLPSRQNTSATAVELPPCSPPPAYETATPEQPKQDTYLNQNAINRLGKAGVSVPEFGIGTSGTATESNPWKSERSQTKAASTTPSTQLSELQTRFARMNSSSSPTTDNTPTPTSPPNEGTTWDQKQSALRTAQTFHKDPTSVSLADAQSAASTANNFRERHGDQIAAGASKANSWNKKYNIAGKVSEGAGRFSSYLEKQASPVSESPAVATTPVSPVGSAAAAAAARGGGEGDVHASINRKPPPPPPPKKPTGMHVPPPVPLGTKPTF